MILTYLLVVLSFCCFSSAGSENPLPLADDPTYFYNMVELVCSEGYNIQEHTVVTEDGYILGLYRIFGERKPPKVVKKKSHYRQVHLRYHPDFITCINDSLTETTTGHVVLMSHGLTASSECWILQGPNYDLAYILADKGYDVWLSNIRGNFYSRRHKTLKPSEKEFWDFSFHENGVYDMTSVIDYILNLTGAPKLTYVGHSMGTTMFFAMASAKPEYNEKIQLFVGLTPVTQLRRKNFSFAKQGVVNFIMSIIVAFLRRGVYEILPRLDLANVVAKYLCAKGSQLQDICYDFSFFFTGHQSKLFLRERLPVYLTHGLSGSSLKTYFHFAQQLDAPYFQYYDYGPEENFQRYGQAEAPEYDLRKVTAPVALFYSRGDYVSDLKDIAELKSLLPRVVGSREFTLYNHVDFIWAYNARDLIYPGVLEFIDEFRNK